MDFQCLRNYIDYGKILNVLKNLNSEKQVRLFFKILFKHVWHFPLLFLNLSSAVSHVAIAFVDGQKLITVAV